MLMDDIFRLRRTLEADMTDVPSIPRADETLPLLRIEELLRADAFPHAIEHLDVRETHISWVILTGPFAYKIKKPVKLEFIDASTLERRHHLCEEELRLNRRCVADLYLDVVPIVRVAGRLSIGAAGPAIEYAVRMRQFDPTNELLALLEAHCVSLSEIVTLAELLADFHLRADVARATGAHPKTQQVYDAVLGNLAQLIGHLDPMKPSATLRPLIDWTLDNARVLEATFQLREESGYIRECHGNLHAANIVRWQGRLVPFDCIEFDPKLRWIDVMDDIAFLVMDLVSRNRPDLAFALLSRYLEVTGDYEGLPLLRFYAVYRALVRAKVDEFAAERVPQRAEEFRRRLAQRIHTATQWIAPQRPILVLMHGPSGSGKSWLSERLGPALAAVRLRSDLERKRLAGIQPHESAAADVRQGIYSAKFSHRTYGRLADCAELCLQAGLTTIVDAAFLDAADRELFRNLATRLGAPHVIVSCHSDAATLTRRVVERPQGHKDVSDADLRVLEAQLHSMQPFSASEQPHVLVTDTGDTTAVQRIAAAIGSTSLPLTDVMRGL